MGPQRVCGSCCPTRIIGQGTRRRRVGKVGQWIKWEGEEKEKGPRKERDREKEKTYCSFEIKKVNILRKTG